MREIRRYKNRKYYDVKHAKYINLAAFVNILRNGEDDEIKVLFGDRDMTFETMLSALRVLEIPEQDLFTILMKYPLKEKASIEKEEDISLPENYLNDGAR